MNEREVLKLALEALKHFEKAGLATLKTIEAITAIKEALAQLSKPWVGLTEDEAEDIWNHYCDELGEASINDAPDIARAIESALRSKNT